MTRRLRLSVLTIAAALVLVPTLARTHQKIEHRETTRLSIKHSWLGVAPPTKASIAPVVVAVVPAPVARVSRPHSPVSHIAPLVVPLPLVVIASSDPLRGPPASSL